MKKKTLKEIMEADITTLTKEEQDIRINERKKRIAELQKKLMELK